MLTGIEYTMKYIQIVHQHLLVPRHLNGMYCINALVILTEKKHDNIELHKTLTNCPTSE